MALITWDSYVSVSLSSTATDNMAPKQTNTINFSAELFDYAESKYDISAQTAARVK